MKKVYEKPQASAFELLTSHKLLLPISEGGTTNESLSRKHRQYDDDLYDDDIDDWDDEDIDVGDDPIFLISF